MPDRRFLIAGLGEVLWDLFPDGPKLGGAPANFAYISTLLGNKGVIASRIGEDDLGTKAEEQLHLRGLDCTHIQLDRSLPTGTVKVELGPQGQPTFDISEPAAWDSLTWTDQWQEMAAKVDAVCFGSLAQRSKQSRETIQKFLEHTRPDALRIFDVNLRLHYYSAEILVTSCKLADVVKMNEDELPEVLQQLGLQQADMETAARQICQKYDLRLVCITRGAAGSMLVSKSSTHVHPGLAVKVADTVGAGDAFTAGLVHEYFKHGRKDADLNEKALAAMNDRGSRAGAWVASRTGGMPEPDKNGPNWQEV